MRCMTQTSAVEASPAATVRTAAAVVRRLAPGPPWLSGRLRFPIPARHSASMFSCEKLPSRSWRSARGAISSLTSRAAPRTSSCAWTAMVTVRDGTGMTENLIGLSTGATVAVTDLGSGTPLVLLHGVCMSRHFFGRNIDALAAAGHRVVAPDLRGHGASPSSEGGHSIGQYARDARALIEHLELDD